MLVLGRLKDESIIIGDEIEIKIVDVHGDKVRLGITAPRSVSVHRKEIYDRIVEERKLADWYQLVIANIPSGPNSLISLYCSADRRLVKEVISFNDGSSEDLISEHPMEAFDWAVYGKASEKAINDFLSK